nr:hypothetical protein GCM10025699_10390 [Microbacterium flavescens]
MNTSVGRRIGTYVLATLIVVSTMLPLGWMVISGFKGKSEVVKTPFQFFPEIWLWQNYVDILQDPAFVQAMVLTFIGALIFTLLSLTVNSFAAYVFARLDFRGKRFWWIFCITPMFIPGMAILLTSFVVVSNLGMLNTLAVLIIPGVAAAAQMFFIRQFYLNTPIAIEEAPSSTAPDAGASSGRSSCRSRRASSSWWASARTSPTGTRTCGPSSRSRTRACSRSCSTSQASAASAATSGASSWPAPRSPPCRRSSWC